MTELSACTNASRTILGGETITHPDLVVSLRASHCQSCDRWEFPSRSYCPTCSSTPVEAGLSTDGRLAGFTAVLHAPPGALVEAPYVVGLVEFPERISVLAMMPGVAIEDVAIGIEVETISALIGESIEYVVRLAP